jgi:hypothetical protein
MAAQTGVGYQEVPAIHGYMKVGERWAPDDVVTQFENFLGKGLQGNGIYDLYQGTIDAIRNFQMFGSGFHLVVESFNSLSNAAGMGLGDALGGLFTGDPTRALSGMKQLASSPFAMIQDVRGGLRLNKALMNPEWARVNDPVGLEIAQKLVGGGMRAQIETKLSRLIADHFQKAWADLMVFKPFSSLGHAMRGCSSAIMDFVVPFSKNGATMRQYLNEVARWERKHPGEAMSNEQARNIAYEVREHMDDIFGKMAMENVGMDATMRSLLSAVIQYPTWNIGTARVGTRAVLGARDLLMKAADLMQGKEVRQLETKDRVALGYAAGLLFVVGMVGALTHQAMTGKPPEKLEDFFFPATGQTKANGSPERLQFPTYLKDTMGMTKHPFATIGAKLAAPLHIVTDLIANKDYWGSQIYDPHDWAGQKVLDALTYMGKSSMPFSLSGYQQTVSKTPGMMVMNALGARPVSRQYTNTPAQQMIDEILQLKRGTSTKAEADKGHIKAELYNMAHTDIAGFNKGLREAVDAGKLSAEEAKQMVKNASAHPMANHLKSLSLEQAIGVWNVASDTERQILAEAMVGKIGRASTEKRAEMGTQLFPVLKDLRRVRKVKDQADELNYKVRQAQDEEKYNRGPGMRKIFPLLKSKSTLD